MPEARRRPSGAADRADDVALLRQAAAEAAVLALDFFDRGGVRRWDKSPGNPVSAADLAVDAQLKSTLSAARPDYGWLSEETVDDPRRLACRRCWIVDPIDGTRDFIRGRTGWAVSVALVEDGSPVAAALVAPARGQTFWAEEGYGATLNGATIGVSHRAELAGARLPVDAASLKARFWPEPWDAVAVERPNSLALRMAHVASGVADGWIEGRTIAEWDVAAAALIVAEAGGRVADGSGAAITFNRPLPVIAGVVAATPALLGALGRQLGGAMAAVRSR